MSGSGSSIGQRSASTGSLPWLQLQYQQQQQQKQMLQAHSPLYYSSFMVASASPPLTFRKPLKTGPALSAKEKLGFSMIRRLIGRKKAGMCLLVLVSLLVLFSFLFTLNKDDYLLWEAGSHPSKVSARLIADGHIAFAQRRHPVPSPYSGRLGSTGKTSELNLFELDKSHSLPLIVNRSSFQSPFFSVESSLPPGHPCKKFTLPPPPADKKRTGPRPCPVCYLPVEKAIELMPSAPSESPVLKKLTYVTEKVLVSTPDGNGGSEFGGYPTLKQREEYFSIEENMNVHCGFVKGSKPGNATGFDLDEGDLSDMDKCSGIVVASAIFGNYDELQQPKNVSEKAKREVCFFMFVDQKTEAFLSKTAALGGSKRIGLWRIVVVRNLPYKDPRRNGKIPKLLLHRLFPNARFSLWIDGKLELVVDPYQILERFLWRSHDTFAISRHYRRFDVFDEAEANKAAGKYDNASIDKQIEFYKSEGLTHYSSSKYPITSDVPEGCVIVREHTPITNLFTCLWFNEVDRFTSRDQISFAIVRDKIISRVNWRVNMFLDCERRNFVVQEYHRDILEQRRSRRPPPMPKHQLPKMSLEGLSGKTVGDKFSDKNYTGPGHKGSTRHVREKRPVNSRHRKIRLGSKATEIS